MLLLVALGPACGDSEPDRPRNPAEGAVERAQRSLDERRAGRIEFALTASVDEGSPVGFEIEGKYEFDGEKELAIADLTYRQVLGEDSTETRVLSTGDDAWVVVDGDATELSAEQTRALRVGDGGKPSAVPALDIAEWLVDGELEEAGGRATVTGEVDASALVADLQVMAAQVAGTSGRELDTETAKQIDAAVEESEMTVQTARGELRKLTAQVDFGAQVPAALRETLGSYAAARLELSMSVEDISTPLRVEAPP